MMLQLQLLPASQDHCCLLHKDRLHWTCEESRRKNPPKGAKRKISLVLMIPSQRCAEFSDESLTVSGGKLFCTGFREELSLKQSVMYNQRNIKTVKKSKPRKKAQDKTIIESDKHPLGETLSEEQKLYTYIV